VGKLGQSEEMGGHQNSTGSCEQPSRHALANFCVNLTPTV
jgi:hypothetical protein